MLAHACPSIKLLLQNVSIGRTLKEDNSFLVLNTTTYKFSYIIIVTIIVEGIFVLYLCIININLYYASV